MKERFDDSWTKQTMETRAYAAECDLKKCHRTLYTAIGDWLSDPYETLALLIEASLRGEGKEAAQKLIEEFADNIAAKQ